MRCSPARREPGPLELQIELACNGMFGEKDGARRAPALRHRPLRSGGLAALLRLRDAARARGRDARRGLVGPAARGAQPLLQRGRPGDPARALRAPQRDARARARGDRARAHRHRLALAAGRDLPQDAAQLQLAAALHGGLPRVPLRLLAGAAVRVDQGAQSRALGADPRGRRARPVRPGRRQLGRARLQPALRRVARAPVPARPALVRGASSAAATASSGARTRSATPASCRRSCASAGITRFLTQKLSWNRFNRPEHHTLTWQGDDGSEVLAHYPPADTYNSEVSVAELLKVVARLPRPRPLAHEPARLRLRRRRRRPDAGHARDAPARAPTCRACRARRSGRARSSSTRSRPTAAIGPSSSGELYFEYHRGVYTSQARTKRGNRRVRAGAARRRVPRLPGRRLPARRARPAVEAAPAAAVPRHPAGLVDRARVRGRRARSRRGRSRRGRARPAGGHARQHGRVRAARGRRRCACARPRRSGRRASSSPATRCASTA